MSLLIKNWQMADWKELLKWAKIGANNAMIGEFTEVEEVPPHGRLIDADRVSLEGGPYEYDEWCKWALDQYQDAPTIIPAEEGE